MIYPMLKSHPGGEVIKYAIGKDMTNMFNGVDTQVNPIIY